MLKLPVAALEEDFRKIRQPGARPASPRPTVPKPAAAPRPAVEPEPQRGGGDDRPEDLFIDSEPPEGFKPPADEPLRPVVEPLPPAERAFCELLFEHERDGALADLIVKYAPEEVLVHPFTRKFVAAWREETEGAGAEDVFARLRQGLPPGECGLLDGILLGNGRSGLSELEPQQILQGLLRRLWIAAVRRRQGELPAASSPESDALRLALSSRARMLQRGPWPRAAALMVSATLA